MPRYVSFIGDIDRLLWTTDDATRILLEEYCVSKGIPFGEVVSCLDLVFNGLIHGLYGRLGGDNGVGCFAYKG